jgi:hypothetical protein
MLKQVLRSRKLAATAGAVTIYALTGVLLWAQSPDLAIIVNAKNPASNISLADLRKTFSGDRRGWDGKETLIIVPAPDTPERATMLRVIYRMSEVQYKEYWLGKIFRGEATSEPVVVVSRRLATDGVAAMSHAIACIPLSEVRGGSVKILKIDGHSPGENGYPLR